MGTRAWEAVEHPAGAPAHEADLGAIWRRVETLRTVLLLTGTAEQTARKERRQKKELSTRNVIVESWCTKIGGSVE